MDTDSQSNFVRIEYLDGVSVSANKADVKLLINKSNRKRKFVHYWTPTGESEQLDYQTMKAMKKFKLSPGNVGVKGLYYCNPIEPTQTTEELDENVDCSDLLELVEPETLNLIESMLSENELSQYCAPAPSEHGMNDSNLTWQSDLSEQSSAPKSSPSTTPRSKKKERVKPLQELLFRRWFKRIDGFGGDFKAECNTCGSKIRSQCSRVGNIIKHLMMIHPKEWEIYTAAKELCLKELPFDHLLDPIVPLQKAAPKEELIFQRWAQRIDGIKSGCYAQCNFCRARIRVQMRQTGRTINIVRHLKAKHPDEHKAYVEARKAKEIKIAEFDSDDTIVANSCPDERTDGSDDGESIYEIHKEETRHESLFVRFYSVVHSIGGTIHAECNICAQHSHYTTETTTIIGESRASSVFRNHVKQMHPLSYIEYLEEYTSTHKSNAKVSLKSINTALAEYIVNATQPTAIIDDVFFRKLIKDMTTCDADSAFNVTLLEKEIEERFEREEEETIENLRNIKYVCATVDVWTNKRGTFLGSAFHWLEFESLRRISMPFMYRRLESRLSDEKIKEHLQTMSQKYRVNEKLIAVMTNNGWNHENAFEGLCVSTHESIEMSEFHQINIDSQLSVTFIMSQVLTVDAANAFTDNSYRIIHNHVFQRLNSFWSISREIAETEEVVRPSGGSCISLFNSLHFITTKGLGAINGMCIRLGILQLTDSDYQFLIEFMQITKPIAAAIEHLMNPTCYFAAVLPMIHTIDRAFCSLLQNEFRYCRPLLRAIRNGFTSRFEYCFDVEDVRCKTAVLATCTHPFFKTRWLPTKDAVLSEIVTNAALETNQNDVKEESRTSEADDELDNVESHFRSDGNKQMTVKQMIQEVQAFLKSPCAEGESDLSQLGTYESICELFSKYNTILPSSTAVEDMFGFTKMQEDPHRNTSDENLAEQKFLLKFHLQNSAE